jgi:hypothetical protein
MGKAQVIGVGMVPFAKPGKHEPYEVMAGKAIARRNRAPRTARADCLARVRYGRQ